MKKLTLGLLLACSLSSCAVMFQGSKKEVSIKSMTPDASIYVDGDLKGTDAVSLKLARKNNHTVMVKKAGFDTQTVQIEKHTQAGWVIFDIFVNLLALPVDAITGAWNGFDKDKITVELTPSKESK